MQKSSPNPTHDPTPVTAMPLSVWAALILLGLVWGSSFFFGRVIMLEMPVITANFFRVMPAAVVLWLAIAMLRLPLLSGSGVLVSIIVMGLFNNVIPFSLILFGQKEIGSGLASIINAMTPIWTLLIANAFTEDEKLTRRKIVGVGLGFAGVALLLGSNIGDGLSASLLAQLSVLGASVSYGVSAVYGKRFRGQPVIAVAASQLTASSCMIGLLALLIDQPWNLAVPSAPVIWSLAGISLLCTAFAYFLFFNILSKAGATNASLVTLLVPPSAILLGWLFLGETLSPVQMLAILVIGAGLLVQDGRIFTRRR